MPPTWHRNDTSGVQAVDSMGNVTFASLRDDLAALRAAAPAGIVDAAVTSVGTSERGRDIHCIRIGRNPAVPVLIAGCHHAREWISVEVPYLFAEYLVTQYNVDPRVKRLVDARDIWIVPMINPDGHERTMTDRLWRKNRPPAGRRSVDLNRNYDTTAWPIVRGHYSSSPSTDTYRGPLAGYAREVQVMQALVNARQFKGTLDFHSYSQWVMYPWAGRETPPPDAHQLRMANALKAAIDTRVGTYQVEQASRLYHRLEGVDPLDSRIPGGMMDYVLEHVPGAIAITIELDPEKMDPRGFILSEADIPVAFERMKGAVLTFLQSVAAFPSPPAERAPIHVAVGMSNEVAVYDPPVEEVFVGF
ncbi:MAG TPA: M14 family zinc carboxypeptidase [Longimicrobium sp.]|nr:M14 family zinc carboxypeptidase [Longimicrobium sp.]